MTTKNYTEEYLQINGISQYMLHYPANSKEVVIMLHGGPGIPNSYIGYHLASHLNFCNVVYYDQRGCGKTQIKSKMKVQEITLENMIEDLRQTIVHVKKKYQTERILLVGHSWGSMLGTQYILKYPKDVIGFIGYGAVTDQTTQERHFYEVLKKSIANSGTKKELKMFNKVNENYPYCSKEEFAKGSLMISKLFEKHGYQKNAFMPIYLKSPIFSFFKDGAQMSKSEKLNEKMLADILFGYDIHDITDYKAPVFYILGRHDEWTSSVIAAKYFEIIHAPKKGLYWIEDAGHMVDTDNPTAFSQSIKEIISQL